ncbi:MAG: alpha/beta hydrolase [Rhodobacteraceae bacterium]|nr:alpha/beta hydrolase [Paracoccaceae bacterium]
MPDPQFLMHDDHRIAYRQRGGLMPGLVFLPGLMSDMDGTKALFIDEDCRRSGRACLRFDYSGHGLSDGTFTDRTIRHWIDETRQVIMLCGAGDPRILIGSSMGAWIALHLAREHPEAVAGLVLIAAAPDFTTSLMDDLTPAQDRDLQTRGVFALTSDSGEDSIPITQRLIDDGASVSVLDQPLSLPIPVRLLHGDRDRDVPLAHALALLAHVDCGDLSLTVMKGEGHRMSSPRCLQAIRNAVLDIASSNRTS